MKLAIYGYGNIGRGVEAAVRLNPDLTLTGVYTRRDPASVKTKTDVPKSKIFDVVASLKGVAVPAPVHTGDVILADVAGTGVDMVATKTVK